MAWRYVVEVVAVLVMIGGIGAILYGVAKNTIALSARTIQFLAVTFILPAVLILSLEGRMGNEGVAALFGVIVGYALMALGKNE